MTGKIAVRIASALVMLAGLFAGTFSISAAPPAEKRTGQTERKSEIGQRDKLRRVLLQRPDAFRTTITEKLLIYSSNGSSGASAGTPETLIRARRILRNVQNPRWSTLIAAIVRTKSANHD